MSEAYLNNLNFKFVKSPVGGDYNSEKPSVEISFTGIGFQKNTTTKVMAKYVEIDETNEAQYNYNPSPLGTENTFTPEFLTENLYTGLKNFLAPGFDVIYVKVIKVKASQMSNDYNVVFEFYPVSPINNSLATPFGRATATSVTDGDMKAPIVNLYNQTRDLGEFVFSYTKNNEDTVNFDEIDKMTEGVPKYFKYELQKDDRDWKDATLLYKDTTDENGIINDEILNSYPVLSDGTIKSSKNYWDFPTDFTEHKSGKYCLRVCLVDNEDRKVTPYQSTIITCSNTNYDSNEIAYFKPVFKYNTASELEFNKDYAITDTPHFYLTIPTKDNDYSGVSDYMSKVVYYRYSEILYQIDDVKWNVFTKLNNKIQYDFYMTWLGASGQGGVIKDGKKTIYLQISDGVGNTSNIYQYADGGTVDEWKKDSVRNITLYRQPPNSIVFNVIGSSGSEHYTGMCKIDKNGNIDKENKSKEFRFIPSNKIDVMISAQDNLGLPLQYKLGIGNAINNIEWKDFDANNNNYIPFYLESESNDSIFENNEIVTINLLFRSSAGLVSEMQTRTIYYNTMLLKADNFNLREH